jgi:hypothetical protein
MDRTQLIHSLDDEISRLKQARQLLAGNETHGITATASTNGRRGPTAHVCSSPGTYQRGTEETLSKGEGRKERVTEW